MSMRDWQLLQFKFTTLILCWCVLEMKRSAFFILQILLVSECVFAVQINYIKVPSSVRNDTKRPVVLDCNYSVRPDDTDLVLKWLLNEQVVYQWIPPQKPQTLGVLRNRVDVSYTASNDPKTAYRALKIINPTTDIAGEYKCYVSTFADEDFSWKKMVVFEQEKSLEMFVSKPNNSKINFTCVASEAYPQPKVFMYRERKEEMISRNSLEPIEWDTKRHESDGRFSTFTTSSAKLDDLIPGDLIFCELRIPATGYVRRKSLIYYPYDMMQWDSSSYIMQYNKLLILCVILLTYF